MKRYYGPFKILEHIGVVAYRLDLPPEAKIHSVFHVSLLRPAHGNPTLVPLPNTMHKDFSFTPKAILKQRQKGPLTQVLVEWEEPTNIEATWESFDELRLRFPTFCVNNPATSSLEDELVAKEEAIDTSPSNNSPTGIQHRPKRKIRKPTRFLE